MSTVLPHAKTLAVAQLVHWIAADWHAFPDHLLARQLISEGIRKLHDGASSSRGTGKYLGHAHWSLEAQRILKESGTLASARRELAHEHVVPVGVVIARLLEVAPRQTFNETAELVKTVSLVAIISRQEEKLLRANGLTARMPLGWTWSDGHLWARYEEVGLLNRIQTA